MTSGCADSGWLHPESLKKESSAGPNDGTGHFHQGFNGGAMNRIKKGLAGLAAAGLSTVATLAGAQPAHATVPSTQLEFWDLRGDVYSIFIHGPNQVPVNTVK